ncbi:hypothetical protein Pmani_006690 [Petrolisthes manimaculis]|uniref:Uncharacterized protein n=1 Tax=Petrolisthes manimaculis TaxID=1843537 RepID=A0AAE1ULI3_9EUCA|nr:hypothetical protein Pmani_006690 [Petrolisthes manimaculis]
MDQVGQDVTWPKPQHLSHLAYRDEDSITSGPDGTVRQPASQGQDNYRGSRAWTDRDRKRDRQTDKLGLRDHTPSAPTGTDYLFTPHSLTRPISNTASIPTP